MQRGVLMGTPKEVPKEINDALSIWYRNAAILRFLQVTIGVIAIVLTITVASKIVGTEPKLLGIEGGAWVAWGAAIATGLLTSLNVSNKANNMWNGWRILNEAKLRYVHQDDYDICKLITAYQEGEKIIGGVDIKVGGGS